MNVCLASITATAATSALDITRYESSCISTNNWRARNFGIGCGEEPITKIFEAVQAFGGNTEAQNDRTLVVLERIK